MKGNLNIIFPQNGTISDECADEAKKKRFNTERIRSKPGKLTAEEEEKVSAARSPLVILVWGHFENWP